MATGSYIDATGFHRATLVERKANLETLWQTVFGASVDLDADSPDGQIIGILAEMFYDLDGLAETVYNGLANPNGATGTLLSNLVKLNGITRKADGYTIVTATVSGTPGTVIPTTALARCTAIADTTVTFSPYPSDIIIGASGAASSYWRCNTPGDYAVPPETLTRIQSVIPGWVGIGNVFAGTPGFLRESDERLRVRRNRSVGKPSQGMTDSIWASLLADVPNVARAAVWENREGTVIELPGGGILPGKSILAIVDGGLDEAIADCIWRKIPVGCGMSGDISVNVTDSQGHVQVIKFSRPTDVNVYITLNLRAKSGWPTDGASKIISAIVREAAVSGNVEIGGDAHNEFSWSDVVRWAQMDVSGFDVASVWLGTSASPTTWANLPINFNAAARVAASRIVVNVT